MSDLNNEASSLQNINTKLSSPNLKRAQLYLGTIIFLFSFLIIFMIKVFNASDWEQRVDIFLGVGSEGSDFFIFLMTGFFISPYLIGWPFWKFRQTLIKQLLISKSLSEWIAIRKRTMPFLLTSFVIQIIAGYLITTFAYYFFVT